jgi:formate dehydrogenase accessory protein FdhE
VGADASPIVVREGYARFEAVTQWDARIRRAEVLASEFLFAAEILGFYRQIAIFQRDFYLKLRANREVLARVSFVGSLRNELHLPALLPQFPEFLKLVGRAAPAPLAAFAKELNESRDAARFSEMLAGYWENGARHEPVLDEASTFCARAFLQPCAELLASQHAMPPAIVRRMVCPLCDGAPQLGVLRPEGDGGKRTLLCAFCAAEWDFTRIVCPACGEEDEKKVYFYTADKPTHVRVEACETCKNYLLSVDLTKNGHAIPAVDEIAAMPLNLWAQEKGYTKIQRNLFGM